MSRSVQRKVKARNRLIAGALSLGAHALVLGAIFAMHATGPMMIEPEPIEVAMIKLPPPPPDPPRPPAPKKGEPKPAKVMAKPVKTLRKTPRPPPTVEPVFARTSAKPEPTNELSESDVAGALTAGSGSGGGGDCNMVRRLQAALRKDRQVQSTVAQAHRGKALLMWNGDWVPHPGQEGHGLAGVREAILVEVGFAPEACKKERVHGLVVLSLNDGPGAARLALGDGDWRWSDLLFAK